MLIFGLHQSMDFTRLNLTPYSLGVVMQDEGKTCTVTTVTNGSVLVGHINVSCSLNVEGALLKAKVPQHGHRIQAPLGLL